mmetsp:Transcript_31145/g.47511  ORF Transcript_31145/g.47511 Transcript_31145/m.47511 type:complete len:160 (+) Transcript_31145:2400-2879(+)
MKSLIPLFSSSPCISEKCWGIEKALIDIDCVASAMVSEQLNAFPSILPTRITCVKSPVAGTAIIKESLSFEVEIKVTCAAGRVCETLRVANNVPSFPDKSDTVPAAVEAATIEPSRFEHNWQTLSGSEACHKIQSTSVCERLMPKTVFPRDAACEQSAG